MRQTGHSGDLSANQSLLNLAHTLHHSAGAGSSEAEAEAERSQRAGQGPAVRDMLAESCQVHAEPLRESHSIRLLKCSGSDFCGFTSVFLFCLILPLS